MTTLIQRLRRIAGAALLLAGTATASQAATIDFLFNGHGNAATTSCAVDCVDALVSGVADDWAGLLSPIPGTWEVLSSINLTGAIGSGSWIFADVPSGTNSLLGSLIVSGGPSLLPGVVKLDLVYVVEGGTGIFSGATGSGTSTLYGNAGTGDYTEAGAFSVTTVPEPSTVLLLAGGIFAIGLLRRRRAI